MGAARLLCTGTVVTVGLGSQLLPLGMAGLAALGIAVAVGAMLLRRRLGWVRVGVWIGLATVARLAAAATTGIALGVAHPLGVAITTLAAVEVAGSFAVTPGNAGVGAAAVAFALSRGGIPSALGLSIGATFQLADTAASVAVGLVGLAALARGRSYWRRKLGNSESPPEPVLRARGRSSASAKLGTIVRRRLPPSPVATTVTQT